MSGDLPPADLIAFQAFFKASKKSAHQAKPTKKCTHCECNLFVLGFNVWHFTCDICSASTCADCTPRRNADGKKDEQGKRICRLCMKFSQGESYDAVVKVGFLKDLFDRGWQVQMDPNAKVGLCTGVRVAPIGLSTLARHGSSTSFVRPTRPSCRSGTDVHTEGFSVKVATLGDAGQRCVFLDTAALNLTALSVTDVSGLLATTGDPMKALENMLQELKRRESFIREVAFLFADVFLVVVGQISRRDQLELLQLFELSAGIGGKKTHIVVCHNLKSMSHKDLMQAPPGGGLSYFDQMRTLFQMTIQSHVAHINGKARRVDLLHGMFGAGGAIITLQHAFLTRHDPNDADCLNDYTFFVLRQLLANAPPRVFHPMGAIADCAGACIRNYLRISVPAGMQMAVCYHEKAQQLQGGYLPAPVAQEAQAALTLFESEIAKSGPLGKPNAALLEGLTARVYEETVNTIARVGSNLRRLEKAPKVKSVALGATSTHSGDDHVKYNVTRTRALYHGQPVWMTSVHLTLPGLAAGEVENIRRQLQLGEGLTFEARRFGVESTLKLTFDTYILAMPSKQLEQHATGAEATAVVDRDVQPEVVERGSRPFECRNVFALTDKAYIRPSDGAFKLEVRIHTKVPMQCIPEQPTLVYSRGILTVAILVEPTSEDTVDTWSSAAVDLPAAEAPEDANDLDPK